ncbi:hypothetical protein MASR1M101_41680 [Gemmatimonas sp.]
MATGLYATKTARLSDLLFQSPGNTVRWYAERIGATRVVTGKLLCRLRERGLAFNRVPTSSNDDWRWYPSEELAARIRAGTLVDTHQVRIMSLLDDSPWMTTRAISDTLDVSIHTVTCSVRVLWFRGELKPHNPRQPLHSRERRRWALADEDRPITWAEAS